MNFEIGENVRVNKRNGTVIDTTICGAIPKEVFVCFGKRCNYCDGNEICLAATKADWFKNKKCKKLMGRSR